MSDDYRLFHPYSVDDGDDGICESLIVIAGCHAFRRAEATSRDAVHMA